MPCRIKNLLQLEGVGWKVGLVFRDSETEIILQNKRNQSNIFTSNHSCHAELKIRCNLKVSLSSGKVGKWFRSQHLDEEIEILKFT